MCKWCGEWVWVCGYIFIKGFVIEGLRFLKRFLKNIRKVYIDRKNKKDVA